MKKTLALFLTVALGSLFVACGSSSSGGDTTGNGSCTGPTGSTSNPACSSCIESSCSSQFSAFCSAGCNTNGSATGCSQATQDISSCLLANCASQCGATAQGAGGSNGQGAGGSNGQGLGGSNSQGTGGSGTGGSNATGNCATLDACCATLTAGVKDGCTHVVGLGNDASCASLLGTYQNAGQCTGGGNGNVSSSCFYADKGQCIVEHVPMAQKDLYDMACTSNGGMTQDCPTTNVIGCCTLSTAEACYYTGGSDAQTEADCMMAGGTWSTMP